MLSHLMRKNRTQPPFPPDPEPLDPLWDRIREHIDSTDTELKQAVADFYFNSITQNPNLGFPLVEDTLAVFIFTSTSSTSPQVAGDFNGWDGGGHQMTRLTGTNIWFLEILFERDARLDYKYITNGSNWILDPRNPRRVTGGYGPNSEIAMPDYVDPPEIIEYPDIPHGTVSTTSFHSDILNNTRNVRVYLPPGYDETGDPYPVIYVHDGYEYVRLGYMPNVLDYCIAHGICQPMIAVFVDPVNRNNEYWLNDDFERFFIEELVPDMEATFNGTSNPSERGVMGASLGGVTSVQLAHRHPDVFGFAGGHSSALWIDDDAMVDEVANDEYRNVRYYLDAGTYEQSILVPSEHLKDILEASRYDVKWRVWHEGHSWGQWRAHTDEILEYFAPVNGNI